MAKKATAAKTEVKTEETVKTAPVKTETKTETKAEPKTTAAKAAKTTKTVKAKETKETKVNVTVEFQGNNKSVNDIVEAVKEAYKAEGNKDAVETIDLFIQPENGVAYYIVNGKEEGKSVIAISVCGEAAFFIGFMKNSVKYFFPAINTTALSHLQNAQIVIFVFL